MDFSCSEAIWQGQSVDCGFWPSGSNPKEQWTNRQVVRARLDIAQGEEICICYLSEAWPLPQVGATQKPVDFLVDRPMFLHDFSEAVVWDKRRACSRQGELPDVRS